MTLARFVFR